MRWPPAFESDIPNLLRYHYEVTSPADRRYNCFAWAAGVDNCLWGPLPDGPGGYYWPDGVPCESTLDAYMQAFASVGYVACESSDLEDGFEKIALYAVNRVPEHAARQLPSGVWSSKMGLAQDIEHEAFEAVECPDYGQVVQFMKRPRSDEMPVK
jgi:hypothetical protein